MVRLLEDVEVMEKDSASFSCEVSHEEVPAQWFREGIKLRPSDNIRIRQEGATARVGLLCVCVCFLPFYLVSLPLCSVTFVHRKHLHSHLSESPGRRCRGNKICGRKCRVSSPTQSER